MENSASSDNIELNIEKIPDTITSDSPALAGDNLEAAQIATAIAAALGAHPSRSVPCYVFCHRQEGPRHRALPRRRGRVAQEACNASLA